MRQFTFILFTFLSLFLKASAQQFINDNVIAGTTGSHWQGFKSNGLSGVWGFQQNDAMYIGIGSNLYSRGFSANAMGIFNGSVNREDIFLYNQNSPYADFLVLKDNGNVGIGTASPFARLQVKGGAIATSDVNFEKINARLMMAAQVPVLRFTRWTGTALEQHNAFVGQFYNTSNGEYSLGLGTGNSTVSNEDDATSRVTIMLNGNVGIGTNSPEEKLVVAGNFQARKVKVMVNAGADFVFSPGYQLKSLEAVKQYIRQNQHLPEIASAKEMETNGIELAEMNIKLLQKVEELTLYLIEQNEEILKLKEKVKDLEKSRNRK